MKIRTVLFNPKNKAIMKLCTASLLVIPLAFFSACTESEDFSRSTSKSDGKQFKIVDCSTPYYPENKYDFAGEEHNELVDASRGDYPHDTVTNKKVLNFIYEKSVDKYGDTVRDKWPMSVSEAKHILSDSVNNFHSIIEQNDYSTPSSKTFLKGFFEEFYGNKSQFSSYCDVKDFITK